MRHRLITKSKYYKWGNATVISHKYGQISLVKELCRITLQVSPAQVLNFRVIELILENFQFSCINKTTIHHNPQVCSALKIWKYRKKVRSPKSKKKKKTTPNLIHLIIILDIFQLDWFSGKQCKGNQSRSIWCLDEQSSKSSHSGFPFVNFPVSLEFVIPHLSNRGKLLPLTAFTAQKVLLEQGGKFSPEKPSNWLQSGYYNLAIIIQTFGSQGGDGPCKSILWLCFFP